MYNVQSEDFCEEEGFSSEAVEVNNEHREQDVNIDNMDQRMMSVNRMGVVKKYRNEGSGQNKEFDTADDMLKYYRSKSQNMSKPSESQNRPKSQVSSPIEASNSTVRIQSSIPNTLQADVVGRNLLSKKDSFSSIKKSKRTITKTYCQTSSVEKYRDSNE